ncbi:hypothetical protein I6L35_07100 [Aeromonas sp. FDAARGOS 1405]|uniref:hypothetical protein n=1 Tax=unclassified Aeromonas TaxID=257493 RepID=UPI001C22C211|nr:hypothetical protein [Aeromonas sp. FDAARGOS 1405]QXB30912.1 hypothetical protein I6L35_07100 [Aeromonas sp. FDAARGOS 1405]
MSEVLGYAVYSEIENGFLVEASPSFYHWDPASAIMYANPDDAWASASRRGNGLAEAVVIYRNVDGSLSFDAIERAGKAPIGSWIVTVKLDISPKVPHYVTSAGKKIKLSSKEVDAKGYHTKAKADQIAITLNKVEGITASVYEVITT